MRYDLTCLINPDLEDKKAEKKIDEIQKFIVAHSGRDVEVNPTGKKKLAYPIGKNNHAYYAGFVFAADSGSISQIEENLKSNRDLVRFLLVQYEKPTPRRKSEEAEPQKKEPGSAEAKVEEVKVRPKAKAAKVATVETKRKPKPSKAEEKDKEEVKADLADLDKKLDEILKDE